MQIKIRATRHLYPPVDKARAQLSDEERARIATCRERGKRKLKMGRILAAEELLDEACDAIGEAILYAARASAVQASLPEPAKLEEVILPPLAACWGESQPTIQRFLREPDREIASLIQSLQSFLDRE